MEFFPPTYISFLVLTPKRYRQEPSSVLYFFLRQFFRFFLCLDYLIKAVFLSLQSTLHFLCDVISRRGKPTALHNFLFFVALSNLSFVYPSQTMFCNLNKLFKWVTHCFLSGPLYILHVMWIWNSPSLFSLWVLEILTCLFLFILITCPSCCSHATSIVFSALLYRTKSFASSPLFLWENWYSLPYRKIDVHHSHYKLS